MAKPKKRSRKDAAKKPNTVLDKSDNGKVRNTPDNVIKVLSMMGASIKYNMLTDLDELDGVAINDRVKNALWVRSAREHEYQPTLKVWNDTIETIGGENAFHPVQDYLDRVQPSWDGTKRIDTFFVDYFGAAGTEFNCAAGRLWLIAAVRRARKPGTKFDTMVVLEGVQGSEKSSALEVLAIREEWFTDSLPFNATQKVFIEHTLGKWIIEFAELSGLRKSDSEKIKTVLSRRIDRARLAWKTDAQDYKRTCVLAGTTNDNKYLSDPTGNRRFWPVKTGKIDLAGLKRDVNQLWAEAAVAESSDESIVLEQRLWKMAGDVQRDRTNDHPWIDAFMKIADAVYEGTPIKVRTTDVWASLGIDVGRQTMQNNKDLGASMRANHYENKTASFSAKEKGKKAWCTVKEPGDNRVMVTVKWKLDRGPAPYSGEWVASATVADTLPGTVDDGRPPKENDIPF